MQQFDFFDNSDTYRDPQYAAYRSDPHWQRIYRFLKGKLFHITSVGGWKEIEEACCIATSGNRNYESRFADHIVRGSFAFENDYVAMFDFASPTEEEVIRTWGRSHEVITMKGPTVLIELDRGSLAAKLVSNSNGCIPGTERLISGNCIPFVEVWYPESIPTSAVLGVYQVTESARLGLQWKEMNV